ncbi:MAG: hypothetical protein WBO24_03295 [Nitrospirales bacterium]
MTMTKPIDRLSMENAINTAIKMLSGFSHSNQFLSGSQKNDSSCEMTLVDSAIQGPDVRITTKSEEVIHATPHPVSVTPPADIQQ